jgi:hypothetical protein
MVCNPHWNWAILTLATRPTISKPNCSRQGSTICYVNIYIWTSARYPHTYLDLIPSRLLPRARVAEDQNPKSLSCLLHQLSRVRSCRHDESFERCCKAERWEVPTIAEGVSLYIAAASAREETVAEEQGDWQALIDAGAQSLPAGCGPCIGLAQACSDRVRLVSGRLIATSKAEWEVQTQKRALRARSGGCTCIERYYPWIRLV